MDREVRDGPTEEDGFFQHPFEWIMANGKAPAAIPTSQDLLPYVEGVNDARMPLAGRCVRAQRASLRKFRAGE